MPLTPAAAGHDFAAAGHDVDTMLKMLPRRDRYGQDTLAISWLMIRRRCRQLKMILSPLR